MKRPEAATRVVEDAVEDDPHPARVGRVEQLAQRVVAPEERIDAEIVVGVVAMVGGGRKDRRQVERGDADILEVVEAFDDPEEVAPLNPWGGGRRVPRLERAGLARPAGLDANRSGKIW